MALRRTATQFEDLDSPFEDEVTSIETETTTTTTENATQENTMTNAIATQTSTTALTNPSANSLATTNIISDKKDVFRVEYDTVPAIKASQGSFWNDKENLGEKVTLEMVSFQEYWSAAPGDLSADIELVKYSDDGVTSRDGINMQEHIADLKAQGYKNAKMAHRLVIVGELLSADKNGESLVGELVQVDMPDTGRRSFNSYALQASYAVAKGRKTQEEANQLVLMVSTEKSKSGAVFTKITVKGK